MKRSMTTEESRLVDAMCACGCTVCDATGVEFHHLPMARPGALAVGYPLCKEHHKGMSYPGESIHSNRLLFTQKYGPELELMQKAILRAFGKNTQF